MLVDASKSRERKKRIRTRMGLHRDRLILTLRQGSRGVDSAISCVGVRRQQKL